jgi:hypothetical protein
LRQIFVPGIKEEDPKTSKLGHSYVLQPVGGNARYYKLANKDHRSPDDPAQKAIVMLDDVTIGMAEVRFISYPSPLKAAVALQTLSVHVDFNPIFK